MSSLKINAFNKVAVISITNLTSQYCLKVSSTVTNPARSCIFNKRFIKLRILWTRVSVSVDSNLFFVLSELTSFRMPVSPWLPKILMNTDLYQSLANLSQRLWQVEWDGCVSNKLHSIKPTLGYINLSHLGRRDAVTFRRLSIGHSRFSHSYLLNREDQPQCTYCDCALTVVHILLECPHYNILTQRYFSVTTLKDLFETVITHTILDFIKEIVFHNRI